MNTESEWMDDEAGLQRVEPAAARPGDGIEKRGGVEGDHGRPAGRILRRKAAARAIAAIAGISPEALAGATDAEMQMAGWAAVLGQAVDWHLAEDIKTFDKTPARPALRLRLVKRMTDAMEALDAADRRAGAGAGTAVAPQGAVETRQVDGGGGRPGADAGGDSKAEGDIRVLALAALVALAEPGPHGTQGKTLHGRRGPCKKDSLDVLLGMACGQTPGAGEGRGFGYVMAALAGEPGVGERLARVLKNPVVAQVAWMTAEPAHDAGAAARAAMRYDRLVQALLEAAWRHEPGARLVHGLHTALMRQRPERRQQDVLAAGLALESAVVPRVGGETLSMEEALTLLDTCVGWMETCVHARPLYEWAFPASTDLAALAGVQTLVGVTSDAGVAARTVDCASAGRRMRELGERIARLDVESEEARTDLHRRLAAPLITGAGRVHFDAAPAVRSARRRG